MISENELVHIGRMQRTHGTCGELQCRMTNTCWEDHDATFIILKIDEIFVPFRVTDWRTKGSEDVLLTIQGISTEQQASRLIGAETYMLRSDLPADTELPTDLASLNHEHRRRHLNAEHPRRTGQRNTVAATRGSDHRY